MSGGLDVYREQEGAQRRPVRPGGVAALKIAGINTLVGVDEIADQVNEFLEEMHSAGIPCGVIVRETKDEGGAETREVLVTSTCLSREALARELDWFGLQVDVQAEPSTKTDQPVVLNFDSNGLPKREKSVEAACGLRRAFVNWLARHKIGTNAEDVLF
jgi:hypothetical protein